VSDYLQEKEIRNIGPRGPRRRYNRSYELGLGILVIIGVVVVLVVLLVLLID
jgi:hypothetical protein